MIRTDAFPARLKQVVGGARQMADGYQQRWNQPGYLDTVEQKLPGFEGAFEGVLTNAPLPKTAEEFHRMLIKAVVGGMAIGVATEALTRAGKLP